jgi:hypothetical protein
MIIVFYYCYKGEAGIHLGLFPLNYLKCCCNSKYHLWHICPGRKEYDLEYLIEMCYRR